MRSLDISASGVTPRIRRSVGLVLVLFLFASASFATPWTAADAATGTSSIWSTSARPEQLADADEQAVTVGTKFRTSVIGQVTDIRFYRSVKNVGPHVAMLWSGRGDLLAQVAVPEGAAVGWVSVPLRTPVTLEANADYVVAYRAPHGRYSTTIGVFDRNQHVSSGPLTAFAGVYSYGGQYPEREWRGAAYFVDVVLNPIGAPATASASTTQTAVPSSTTPTSRTSTTTSPAQPTLAPTTTVSTPAGPTPALSLPRIPWEGGPAYYSSFPDAARNGWTDPHFLPIAVWWGGVSTDAQARWDKDHGINTYVLLNREDPATTAVLDRSGMSYIGGALSGMSRKSKSWVGDFLDDEVDGRFEPADGEAHLSDLTSRLPDHNKVRYANYSSMILNTWIQEAHASMYVNRFTDAVSVDMYWYTVPFCDWEPFPGAYYYTTAISKSACRTSHSYGLTVDMLRQRDAKDGKLQPVWNFVENVSGAPGEDQQPPLMTPAKIQGAAMNSIIHEARGLVYFNQSFHGACGTGNAVRTAQVSANWACSNLVEAMGTVNNTILGLAPVINTQSYKWSFGPGLDTMLKIKDGHAYIFAMTDGSTGPRTFTLPAGIGGTSVEVLNEDRRLPVSGRSFQDFFNAETTYHIYKIEL